MSMSGAVSLNVMAIHKTLDCYGVPYDEDRLELITKVQHIESSSLSFQYAEAKAVAAAKARSKK
jgi:hypothetical protein